MKAKTILIVSVVLFVSNTSLGQSKIDKSKSDLTEKSGVNHSSQSNSSDDNDSEHFLGSLFLNVFYYATYWTFIGSPNEDHLSNKLTPYPYYDDFSSGNFEKSEQRDTLAIEGRRPKSRFRVDIEESLLFNSRQLYGNYLEVKVRPSKYFYIQADLHQLQERSNFNSNNSSLSLYYFNFGYDRVRTKRFNLGWTLGASYVANNVRKAGVSFGLDTDVFLSKQISLGASTKWSSINSRPVNSFEVQGRYHINRFAISMGYDYLKIGSPSYKFFKVGGGIYF